jgi:iron complex transport system ATP-binding protein
MGLHIRDIYAGFNSTPVIENVSLTVENGEFLTLLGGNGAGKTTLLKVLCGLKKPQDGSVFLDGRDLSSFTAAQRAKIIAYVPQYHQPGMPFSVLDMAVLGCVHRHGIFSQPHKRDYKMALESLNELGIGHLAYNRYTALSGGEQRLVLLARALTQDARFIVLDEPVSNLDLGNQIRVIQVLRKFSESGIGIIMSSHFPEHSLWLNTRTVILQNKELTDDDKAVNVITGERLTELYGVEIRVHQNDNGSRHCEPQFIQELLVK